MPPIPMGALFALQCFHVIFLALHDWVPLGTLNDVKVVRAANPGRKLLTVSPRARASGAVSGDVRGDACFSARTQRHSAEYAACDPSHSDAHHIGCLRRTHCTAKSSLTPDESRNQTLTASFR
jgi:hypothetical protein